MSTCKSFCLMYSQILLTTFDRGNSLSPVPRNFIKASESWSGARIPEFFRFSFLFGSSESNQIKVGSNTLLTNCAQCMDKNRTKYESKFVSNKNNVGTDNNPLLFLKEYHEAESTRSCRDEC